jgi:hypothetical protein
VIVISEKEIDVDELPDTIYNYKDAKEKKQEFYITAELKANEFKSSFSVGDDKEYGGYQNVPLEKGKTYTIAERAITKDKQVSNNLV